MINGPSIRIVLADDHAMFREGVRYLLEKQEDFVVVGEGATGEEAIELVTRLRPEVVLLDISMPGRGGAESLGEIRRRSPGTRVLFLTVHSEDRFAIRVKRAGASGYLIKNNAPERLVTAIRRIAGGDRVFSMELLKEEERLEAERRDVKWTLLALLTAEERMVLERIGAGDGLLEMATGTRMSIRRVQETLMGIVRKFGLRKREDLTRYALRFRLTR